MAPSLWSGRGSEKIYLTLLLICFLYILLTSPIVDHAQAIIRPVRQSTDTGHATGVNNFNLTDTTSTGSRPNSAHNSSTETAGHDEIDLLPPPTEEEIDENKIAQARPYVRAIMDPKDTYFDRLQCPKPFTDRYKILNAQQNLRSESKEHRQEKRFFFALNLYQCEYVLPRLLGSVVEAIKKLGPEDCVLSIVGGRSDDLTTEILWALRKEIEALNVTYYLGTSDVDPWEDGHDRITELAKLRNFALAPLYAQHQRWSTDATVVFINDVSICTDDILELVYQKHFQKADMVCAMDWDNLGTTYYDSWIGRSMNGDMFIEVPQDGSFQFASNLFWNDKEARLRLDQKIPLQVFACWNGAVAFKAEPLLIHRLKFRAAYKNECYTGEPTLFCKDLWALGYSRIAVVSSVNVGYTDEESRRTKELHGYASGNIQRAEQDLDLVTEIQWKGSPPALVKCQFDWTHSSWAPWDEGLAEHLPFDWSRSGYFNAKKPFDQDLEFESDGAHRDEPSPEGEGGEEDTGTEPVSEPAADSGEAA